MTDRAPSLATADEARDLLGADAFAEAVQDGSVRRVQHDGATCYVGADVDRVKRASDPAHLAQLINGEVDEDETDGPRALARNVPRL